jgi:3-isopropylmalate/(R)-2-methylmalate dehydratase small subunit
MSRIIKGLAYVVHDNIDTDQIIPAQYLMLVPTVPEEYQKLGSYALSGLPESLYPTPYVPKGSTRTPYKILIAGRNLGCGSSREHAPIALGAAGCEVAIAASYARIFFRNCIATGELYPYESVEDLSKIIRTGDEVQVNFDDNTLTSGDKTYPLKPLGDVLPVIDAGGLFNYARQNGMIPAQK